MAAQLLSNHISDEAVELMVAYLFVSPAPFTPPGSPLTTFLRFLSLLANFDWLADPLIVNFNNELSGVTTPLTFVLTTPLTLVLWVYWCISINAGSDVSEIVSKFTASRPSLPSIVIATPTERDHVPFLTPSDPVFCRLRLLARESLDVVQEQLERPLRSADCKVRAVFAMTITVGVSNEL